MEKLQSLKELKEGRVWVEFQKVNVMRKNILSHFVNSNSSIH